MTLQEFVDREIKKLEAFQKWWLDNSTTEPELFPMEFSSGNEGMWIEMLAGFDE